MKTKVAKRPVLLFVAMFAALVVVVVMMLRPDRNEDIAGTRSRRDDRMAADAHTRRDRTARSANAAGQLPRFADAPDASGAKYIASAAAEFDKQRDRGGSGRFKTPEVLHLEETRDESWAAPMERELKNRFSAETLERIGLANLRLERVDCRRSSCQVDVSWTGAEQNRPKVTVGTATVPFDPLSHLKHMTGRLGGIVQRIPPAPGERVISGSYMVKHDEDGRYRTSEVILFEQNDIDPDTYARWVEADRERLTQAGKY